MKNKVLEIEADSLIEARKKVKTRTPEGLHILSKKILSDGKQKTAKGVAETVEAAFEKARKKVPADAEIIDEKRRVLPSQKVLEVEAFDIEAARTKVELDIDKTRRIDDLRLKSRGKKGFLGIGKNPDIYEAKVFQHAVVEVVFKRKAKIRVEIGERKAPSKGYCQWCGNSNSPSKVSESSAHFFCSRSCEEKYFKANISSLLFSPDRFIIDATGGDISGMIDSGRRAAQRLTAHCWSCGKTIPMSADKCTSCGKKQKIKL